MTQLPCQFPPPTSSLCRVASADLSLCELADYPQRDLLSRSLFTYHRDWAKPLSSLINHFKPIRAMSGQGYDDEDGAGRGRQQNQPGCEPIFVNTCVDLL